MTDTYFKLFHDQIIKPKVGHVYFCNGSGRDVIAILVTRVGRKYVDYRRVIFTGSKIEIESKVYSYSFVDAICVMQLADEKTTNLVKVLLL